MTDPKNNDFCLPGETPLQRLLRLNIREEGQVGDVSYMGSGMLQNSQPTQPKPKPETKPDDITL